MRTVEPANQAPTSVPSIDEQQLEAVTGGCAVGGCCPGGACGGGAAYSYRTGGGVDPLFMLFAMQLMSGSNSK